MENTPTTIGLADLIANAEINEITATQEIMAAEQELFQSELYKKVEELKLKKKNIQAEKLELESKWIEMMNKAGLKKIEARNGYTVSLKISSWSLKIEDEKEFIKNPENEKFLTRKVTEKISPDKKAIKAAMDEWEIFEWCSIEKKMTLAVKKNI